MHVQSPRPHLCRQARRLWHEPALVHLLAAFAALGVGLLVYILDRPADRVYVLPAGWQGAVAGRPAFGVLAGSLPSLVHAYAFALLMVAAAGPMRAPLLCIGTSLVGWLLEVGQHPAIAGAIAGAVPAWTQGVPLLENSAAYFRYGTFDPVDLVAVAAGSLAAYATILVARRPVRRGGPLRTAAAAVVAVVGIASAIGSGGEGGGETGTSGESLWVWIDAAGPVVEESSVSLSGRVSCDVCPPSETAFGYCPAPSTVPADSQIDVAWRNLTTGDGGPAFHAISRSCSFFFSYCTCSYRHGWWAFVPLSIGVNTIEVRASDPSGAWGAAPITLTRVPPRPEGLVAEAGRGSVTLAWDGVPEATTYNLYWSTARTLTKDTGTKVEDVSSPHTLTGLSDDTTYYFRVTAVSNGYESFESAVVWATPGWRTTVLAPTTATTAWKDTAIAADSMGAAHAHLSYDEHEDYSVVHHNHYLTNAAGSWVSTAIGGASWADAGIAVGPSDGVHLSYTAFAGATHAVPAAGGIASEVVDSDGSCKSSVAVDLAGRPHVAYYASTPSGYELRYAVKESGTWSPVDVLGTSGCRGPGTLALAVDTTGAAHVVYAGDYPDYGLLYASNPGGVWELSRIADASVTAVSVDVDGSGTAHVAYTDNAGRLGYARGGPGTWTVETIESYGAQRAAIAIDAEGLAHVAYLHGGYGEVRYATNGSGTWRIALVDDVGPEALYTASSLAIDVDPEGKVHIGYFDNRLGMLKYATNR